MNEKRPGRYPAGLFLRDGFWWIACLVLYAIWAVGSYPALIHPWWYRDDFVYGLLVERTSFWGGLEQIFLSYLHDGRPLAILAVWPFCVNYYPHAGVNLALHLIQGAGHVAVAIRIAAILARYLPRGQAIVAVAPFLLWAFNGEAVLYSSAYHYVVASFLSVLGLHFILEGSKEGKKSSYRVGGILTAGSLLTLQASATAGMMVWMITVALRLFDRSRWRTMAVLKEGTWLSVSFLVGGLLTTLLALTAKSVRAEAATDLMGKFTYWLELNRTFFSWPGYYPLALDLLIASLVILGVALPIHFFCKARRASVLPLLAALFLATLILPYLGNLVTVANWMSYRTFYLAPLQLTFITAVLFSLTAGARWLTALITLLVIAICLNFMFIAQGNARDYIRTYRAEVRVIDKGQKMALANHLDLIAILPAPAASNPFQVHYPWLDGHECDFSSPYSRGPIICLLSSLRPLRPEGPEWTQLLEKIRGRTNPPGVQIRVEPELHLLYLQVN